MNSIIQCKKMNENNKDDEDHFNVLKLLFKGRLYPRRNDTESVPNYPAITYVDIDANIRTISYPDLLAQCLNIYQKLLTLNIVHWITINNVQNDDNQFKTIGIKCPLVIYGDCFHFTPVFMIVAILLKLPFYYINDRLSLLNVIEQFNFNILKNFIVEKNRSKELLQSLGNNGSYEQIVIIEDYILVYIANSNDQLKTDIQLDVCYIMNTSGTSTNLEWKNSKITRKTVFVPNECIWKNLIDFRHEFNLDTNHSLLICSPFTFDPSICDIFLGLCSFSHIILLDNSLKNIPEKFIQILIDFHITYFTIVPSLWNRISFNLMNCLKTNSNHINLHFINFGGEQSPIIQELRKFILLRNDIQFYNFYGLTEMSVWATLFNLNKHLESAILKEEEPMPIMERALLDTNVCLDQNQMIIIESVQRKCLIYDGNGWTFQRKLCTNDLGKIVGKFIYFIKRNGEDEFFKINGIKFYPRLMERQLMQRFGPTVDGLDCRVEHCHIQLGKWKQLLLIDIVIVVSSSGQNLPSLKQKIINFLRQNQNRTAFRLHLIDSTQILFNQNGKIDLVKFCENINVLAKPTTMKQQWTKEEISNILDFVLQKHLKCEYDKNQLLSSFGIDSMMALEIAIELDNEFFLENENIFEMLLTESFTKIVERIDEMIILRDEDQSYNPFKCDPNELIKMNCNNVELTSNDNAYCQMTLKISHQWLHFMELCVDSSPLIVVLEQKVGNMKKIN